MENDSRKIYGTYTKSGPGSSVCIATGYGLDGPGFESRWGRDFPLVQTGPGAHPVSCTMGTKSFPEVKCGRGVLLTTHSLLAPRSWKSRAIPLPPLWATTGPVTGLLSFTLLYRTDTLFSLKKLLSSSVTNGVLILHSKYNKHFNLSN